MCAHLYTYIILRSTRFSRRICVYTKVITRQNLRIPELNRLGLCFEINIISWIIRFPLCEWYGNEKMQQQQQRRRWWNSGKKRPCNQCQSVLDKKLQQKTRAVACLMWWKYLYLSQRLHCTVTLLLFLSSFAFVKLLIRFNLNPSLKMLDTQYLSLWVSLAFLSPSLPLPLSLSRCVSLSVSTSHFDGVHSCSFGSLAEIWLARKQVPLWKWTKRINIMILKFNYKRKCRDLWKGITADCK